MNRKIISLFLTAITLPALQTHAEAQQPLRQRRWLSEDDFFSLDAPSRVSYPFLAWTSIDALSASGGADAPDTGFTISGASTTAQTLGPTAGETGTITATGSLTVSGSTVAVTISGNNETLNNLGMLKQTGTGRAIRDNTGVTGLVVNNGSTTNSTALIQTADADVIQMAKSPASVLFNNYGTLTSLNASKGGAQAIDFNAIVSGSNTFNNFGTGIAQAQDADSVRPGVNGVITNDGVIKSTRTTDTGDDGIDAQTNSGVTITNANTNSAANPNLIEGARHAITGGNTTGTGAYTMTITNNSHGTIQGDNGSGINIDGINGNELVTISNDGTITGNGSSLNPGETSHDGDAVDVDGLVNLTNTGTIRSLSAINETSEGATVGGGTITNSGTIQGSVGSGGGTATGKGITVLGIDSVTPITAMYGNTTITNSGLIKGDSNSGITIGVSNDGTTVAASGFTSTIQNNAGGIIEGGGATAAAIQTGPDNDTVNNAGQIVADSSGKAVDLGAGDDALNVTGGAASITGDISGGSGTNSLSFDPGAGHGFSYAGVASNFASAEVKSGTVTLSGANTYAGNTTISGGALLAHNSGGSATGTGAVAVQNAATLGGDGEIAGNVTVQSGGIISPGIGIGTLKLDGDLTITSGSKFVFELGTSSDLVTVGGVLAFAGSGQAIVDISDAGLAAGHDYTLVTFSSSTNLSAGNFALGTTPPGFSGTISVDGDSVDLHVAAVPEPSTTLLFGCASLALVAFAFRRNRLAARGGK